MGSTGKILQKPKAANKNNSPNGSRQARYLGFPVKALILGNQVSSNDYQAYCDDCP